MPEALREAWSAAPWPIRLAATLLALQAVVTPVLGAVAVLADGESLGLALFTALFAAAVGAVLLWLAVRLLAGGSLAWVVLFSLSAGGLVAQGSAGLTGPGVVGTLLTGVTVVALLLPASLRWCWSREDAGAGLDLRRPD